MPVECHMGPALSSLKYLGTLLIKRNDSNDLKRKQKLLRSMKVCKFLALGKLLKVKFTSAIN